MDKIKHALHLDKGHEAKTHSDDHESTLRESVHSNVETHQFQEAEADKLISEIPSNQDSTFHDTLSNYSRPSLLESAHPSQGHTEQDDLSPDLIGQTRIPESKLHQMSERKEHTAARPSDMNDPQSMDGRPEGSSAGDDLAL